MNSKETQKSASSPTFFFRNCLNYLDLQKGRLSSWPKFATHVLAILWQVACSKPVPQVDLVLSEWERWCTPPNSHTRQLHRYIHCKTKKMFPLNLKNFNQLHPNSKIGRSVYTKNRFVRKGGFFSTSPTPNSSPHLSWNRPRNPVMSEGRFWSQIFQALRTGLNQLVHLASGSKNRGRPWPRAKKGLKYLGGDGATRFFRFFCGKVSDVESWELYIVFLNE